MLNDRRPKSSAQHEQPLAPVQSGRRPSTPGWRAIFWSRNVENIPLFLGTPISQKFESLGKPLSLCKFLKFKPIKRLWGILSGKQMSIFKLFQNTSTFSWTANTKKYKMFQYSVETGKSTFKKVLLMKVFLAVMFVIHVTSHCFLVTFMHANELRWWNS